MYFSDFLRHIARALPSSAPVAPGFSGSMRCGVWQLDFSSIHYVHSSRSAAYYMYTSDSTTDAYVASPILVSAQFFSDASSSCASFVQFSAGLGFNFSVGPVFLSFSTWGPRGGFSSGFFHFDFKKVQRNVHLIDLVKSFPTSICLRNLASIQPRTSPLKLHS